MKKDENDDERKKPDGEEKPSYVPPQVVTYTKEQLLERIGPAMGCSGDPCPGDGL